MINKTFFNENYNVEFKINNFFKKNDGKTIFFGFPYNFSENFYKKDANYCVNNLKGNWIRVADNNDSLEITTDILGNFRLYYSVSGNKIWISDDYPYILEKLKNNYTINQHELSYWKKHGFTSGGHTFINEIKKVNPASSLIIDKNGVREEFHFKSLENKMDDDKFLETVHKDFEDTFSYLKEMKETKILFFSGGKDSCLLAQYLIKHKIKFKAIYFLINPVNKETLKEANKVKEIAKQLKFDVEIVTLNIDNSIAFKEIVDNQFLDRHFSLLHYYGVKYIKENYGIDVVLINGQASDSIFSFGPTENSLMSYFRRNMMYFPKRIISKVGVILLQLKVKNKFKLPKTEDEKLFALFDEIKYARVLKLNEDESFLEYFKNYIEKVTNFINTFESKEMYVKIVSFLQGSDNQVVFKSAQFHGIKKIVLPFATPEIIYATIKYKNKRKDVSNPKYIVSKILSNKFNFHYPNELIKISNIFCFKSPSYSNKIKIEYNKKVKNIVNK